MCFVLYIYLSKSLNKVVTRIFGFWDLWMGGRIVAKEGVIGLKFPPRSDLTTQKAQEKSRQPIKKASTCSPVLRKNPKLSLLLRSCVFVGFGAGPKIQNFHSNANENDRNETKTSFYPIRTKRQGPKKTENERA